MSVYRSPRVGGLAERFGFYRVAAIGADASRVIAHLNADHALLDWTDPWPAARRSAPHNIRAAVGPDVRCVL
jgi:hypothetical protein